MADSLAIWLYGSRVASVVSDTLERLPGAMASAAGETPDVPDALVELVSGRVERLRQSLSAV